jgi:peptide chain release factor 2
MNEHDFWAVPEKAQQTIAQLKPLNNILKPFEELNATKDDLVVMAELASEDASIEEELNGELARFEKRFNEFEFQAMMSGPEDSSNAFLRIQAGTGGTDACDFANMLLRMYTRWAEDHGYKVELTDILDNDEAGIRNATIRLVGDYAYGRLQSEVGVHRLVRMSPFGSGDKRQTSFAAVDVLPELEQATIEIKPDDVEIQTFSCGGPGGQHVNKTQSGVRLIHKPTGAVAESRSERSQHKNKDNCWKMLYAKLYKIEENKRRAEVERQYDEKGEVAWGNQIRNYVMNPYTLVKDTRTATETAQVQKVLDGDLDQFMEDYLKMVMVKKRNKKSA